MGKIKQIAHQFELVEAIKANDESALRELYQNNYRKVEVFVLKNSGTVPQAKDVYQEAFMATYQNIKADKFVPENETALQGYLYQIAKNKWRDVLRSSRFKKTAAFIDNVHETEDTLESDRTEEEIAQQERLATTMEAFKKLGTECRNLLMQFYFEKKSLREISVKANYAEASARNKKYRCIQKLKELALSPNP